MKRSQLGPLLGTLFSVLLGLLPYQPLRAETWRFALIGDTPYNDHERQELPKIIAAIGAENVDFVIHAGDFKHSRDECSDALFEDRRQMFDASTAPFIYVPGDNEWTDCDRLTAGHHQPLERLAKLRMLFMSGDESLGQRRLQLERQPGEYREHQRWRVGPALFLTLNVPGGNNNYQKTGWPSTEAAARMPQVLAWLREGFALARRDGLRGIVVVMQANPGIKHFNAALAHSGFRDLLAVLTEETAAFPGSVVLVHGDTHWHRIDQPLRDPQTHRTLANFTRVETFGYPFLGWVKGVIDSDAEGNPPALFRFETRRWP